MQNKIIFYNIPQLKQSWVILCSTKCPRNYSQLCKVIAINDFERFVKRKINSTMDIVLNDILMLC